MSKPGPARGSISRAHLARVSEDVGAPTLRRYAAAFLGLLPRRLDRIEQAIAAADTEEAVRVMFDLRSGSEMLGAIRLPAFISAVEATLAIGVTPSRAQLDAVRGEADSVAAALRGYLEGGWPGQT